MEIMGASIRSFLGPFILIKDKYFLPKFAEHYRLVVYTTTDFLVSIALLYLFYHQGMLQVSRTKR